MKAAMRTLARGMVKLLCHILILPLFRVIEPFHHLRISHLWTSRFGPLGFNTHLFLGNLAIHGPERNTTRLFIAGVPANRTLLGLWRRRFTIIESRYFSAFMHYAGETLSETVYCRPLPTELVNYPAIDHGPVLSLNEDDHRRGGTVLESMGLGLADWWVCFQARDPLYHQVRGTGGDSGTHRNCRIENFMAAATEITSRGGFAIRTGAAADRPLPATEDSRLIDYTQTHRSDFGDIYLYANCRFSLLAGTGSIHVPPMFKRPVALVNMMPLLPTPIGSQSLFQPKLFRDRASGRLLSFADLERFRAFDPTYPGGAAFRFAAQVEDCGLEVEENSADDILEICREMFDRIEGRPQSAEISEMQRHFKRRFLGHIPGWEKAPDISGRFLSRHAFLLAE